MVFAGGRERTSDAQFNIAILYLEGAGVPKDEAKAAEWFRQAADRGEPQAQYRLAGLYAAGTGVKRDRIEALIWLDMAAKGGVTDEALRAKLVKNLKPEDIAEAEQRAGARAEAAALR